jgi:hypothetical protein
VSRSTDYLVAGESPGSKLVVHASWAYGRSIRPALLALVHADDATLNSEETDG